METLSSKCRYGKCSGLFAAVLDVCGFVCVVGVVDTNADIATSVSSDAQDSSVHEKQVQDIEKGGKSVEQGQKAALA
jgi:hypothetical protein